MIFPGQQRFCWVGWVNGKQGSRWHQPGNLPAAEVRGFIDGELYATQNHICDPGPQNQSYGYFIFLNW